MILCITKNQVQNVRRRRILAGNVALKQATVLVANSRLPPFKNALRPGKKLVVFRPKAFKNRDGRAEFILYCLHVLHLHLVPSRTRIKLGRRSGPTLKGRCVM